jgi:FdrA protein
METEVKDILVERSRYLDSVGLMRISKKANEVKGVKAAMVAMATDTNLLMLEELGFDLAILEDVSSDDLLIAVDADDRPVFDAVVTLVKAEIEGSAARAPETASVPKSIEDGIREYPEINLVLISVPGRFAAYEAHKALLKGKHVMIFSDNVAVEDEKRLKQTAREKGLLVMGPDCGTAIINGVGLGFANKVPRGNIGIVSASGTGAQEVSSIIARCGHGVSQVIGTGGRDVSEAIGGIVTTMGLQALLDHSQTEVVVIISKVPDEPVAGHILGIARAARPPCIVYFVGYSPKINKDGNIVFTSTLAETAYEALYAATGKRYKSRVETGGAADIVESGTRLPASRKFLRGLFSGGTLAQETLFILASSVKPIHTNMHLAGFPLLDDPAASSGHTIVDLGDDRFTRGRAHPMIDQSYRLSRVVKEFGDPETAVILLDVVLGYGCNSDPGGEIAATLRQLLGSQRVSDRTPVMIASICGTHQDPQGYQSQKQKLESVGVFVAETNARASLAAKALVGK